MDNHILLCNLYDCYGELLTSKQRSCFEDYFFNDLSLTEISENNLVSRNAIHKTIKEVENKLLDFEEKLQLFKKNELLKDCLIYIQGETLKTKINGLFD